MSEEPMAHCSKSVHDALRSFKREELGRSRRGDDDLGPIGRDARSRLENIVHAVSSILNAIDKNLSIKLDFPCADASEIRRGGQSANALPCGLIITYVFDQDFVPISWTSLTVTVGSAQMELDHIRAGYRLTSWVIGAASEFLAPRISLPDEAKGASATA